MPGISVFLYWFFGIWVPSVLNEWLKASLILCHRESSFLWKNCYPVRGKAVVGFHGKCFYQWGITSSICWALFSSFVLLSTLINNWIFHGLKDSFLVQKGHDAFLHQSKEDISSGVCGNPSASVGDCLCMRFSLFLHLIMISFIHCILFHIWISLLFFLSSDGFYSQLRTLYEARECAICPTLVSSLHLLTDLCFHVLHTFLWKVSQSLPSVKSALMIFFFFWVPFPPYFSDIWEICVCSWSETPPTPFLSCPLFN